MRKYFIEPEKTVVINATNIGNKMNGIGNYSLQLIKYLVKSNTRISFIVYLNKSCKKHIEDINFPENFSIRWVSSWLSPDKKFFGHLLRLFYSNYLCLKHLGQLQFNTSPLEVCFFKPNQIVTVHDVIPILFKEFHKKQYLFYKVILKYVLRNIKMVITPSSYTKELVLKYYGLDESKVQVIPLGVNNHSKKVEMNSEHFSPYILYVGRINEMKNISQIVKAFKIVRKSLDISLVVVGDDENKFNQIITDANCDTDTKLGIKFYTNVHESEKFSLMQNALVFIYPTLFEGFGFPPLEAMSNGCPVIVSDNSSFPEVCGNAAYYVDPKNDIEIANGIIEILKNEKLRLNLIERGLERVTLFSWERTALKHLKLMENVLYDSNSLIIRKPAFRKSFILREGKT